MYLIVQVEDGKGGVTVQGKADTGLCKELLMLPSRGGKRRRAEEASRWGGAGRYSWTVAPRPGEMGGGESGTKRVRSGVGG